MRIGVESPLGSFVWTRSEKRLREHIEAGVVPAGPWPNPGPATRWRDHTLDGDVRVESWGEKDVDARLIVRPEGGTLVMGDEAVDFLNDDFHTTIRVMDGETHVADWGFYGSRHEIMHCFSKGDEILTSRLPVTAVTPIEKLGHLWPPGSAKQPNGVWRLGPTGEIRVANKVAKRAWSPADLARLAVEGKSAFAKAMEPYPHIEARAQPGGVTSLTLLPGDLSPIAEFDLGRMRRFVAEGIAVADAVSLGARLPANIPQLVITTDEPRVVEALLPCVGEDTYFQIHAPTLPPELIAALPTKTNVAFTEIPTTPVLQALLARLGEIKHTMPRGLGGYTARPGAIHCSAQLAKRVLVDADLPDGVQVTCEGPGFEDDDGMVALAAIAARVEDLTVSHAQLSGRLGQLSVELPKLKKLGFVSCGLQDADVEDLVGWVQRCPALEVLNVSRNGLRFGVEELNGLDVRVSTAQQFRIPEAEWQVPTAIGSMQGGSFELTRIWVDRMADALERIHAELPEDEHSATLADGLTTIRTAMTAKIKLKTALNRARRVGPAVPERMAGAWRVLDTAVDTLHWARRYEENDYRTESAWDDVKREYHREWFAFTADQGVLLAGLAANWDNDWIPSEHRDPAERARQVLEAQAYA